MSDNQPTAQATDIALLPPAERALVVLKSTETEKQLRELVARTSPISAPVDAAGREEVHRAAMDHKNARVAIEKAGKAAREDATAFSKAVIKEEQRLVAITAEEETRLFELRDTYDAKVKQEKEEAERKERERVAAIREKIDAIKNLPIDSATDNAETLAATLDDLRGFEITFEDFAEFQDEARAARDASIGSLTTMHTAAAAREAAEAAAREAEAKLAEQRAELERQQRELAEQQAEIARQRAELEAAKKPAVVAGPNEPPPEVLDECAHDYLRSDGVCTECGTQCALPPVGDAIPDAAMEQAVLTGTGAWRIDADASGEPAVEHVDTMSLTALDQPRQRAENAAVAYILDNTPPSPLPESERRVIVEPEFAGFDMAGGPDVHVEMVTITRDEYDSLLTRSRWLECLEAAGVDNWEGIDEALRINRERVPA
ncbi:hypothetical protein DC1_00026 [Burkholderia phage DC1]|uniref:Uncharacterized protein n=1 Tax=Burkholderia phage DC1 TaxID=2881398 RepID=I6NMK7_9CAUD|nr:hypothetical protein B862_gp57 [Burkholderia phage DC1]AEZ50844.1 hypothetical protein DC1_00026 [Burkholderia phage DC1]